LAVAVCPLFSAGSRVDDAMCPGLKKVNTLKGCRQELTEPQIGLKKPRKIIQLI
jgi:hypothetical protein